MEWPEPPATESKVLKDLPVRDLNEKEQVEWMVDIAANLLVTKIPASTFLDPRDGRPHTLCKESDSEQVNEIVKITLAIMYAKRIVREKLKDSGILSFQETSFRSRK